MKTFYSSAFLSVIFGFFVLFQSSGQHLQRAETTQKYHFHNIYEDQDIRKGNQNIAVEVFQTFNCSQCRSFAKEVLPLLKTQYVDQQKAEVMVYTVSDDEIESETEPAKALHCAGLQQKFWETQTAFSQHDLELDKTAVEEIIATIEMDLVTFNECMNADTTLTALQEARIMASKRNITIYPTMLINNQRLIYYQPWENIERVMNNFQFSMTNFQKSPNF